MASSRWKRFAFFDRTTLSLPPDVIDDVFSAPRGQPGGSGGGGGDDDGKKKKKKQQQGDGKGKGKGKGKASLFGGGDGKGGGREDAAVDDADSLGADDDDDGTPTPDLYSLSVCRASLPASSSAAAQQQQQAAAGGDADGGTGLAGMLRSSSAISGGGGAPESEHATGGRGGDVTTLTPAGVVAGGASSPTGNSKSSSSSSSSSGGSDLVLAFLTSRSTNLVHCVDVTVRCNPLSTPPTAAASASNPSNESLASAAAAAAAAAERRPSEANIAGASSGEGKVESADGGRAGGAAAGMVADLEDLDGWRGHYEPFVYGLVRSDSSSGGGGGESGGGGGGERSRAEMSIIAEHMGGTTGTTGTAETTTAASTRARVVGMATTTTTTTTAAAAATPTTTVHVASITDTPRTTGVAVHVDPHLYLASTSPRTSTSTVSNTTYGPSKLYQPPQKFDFGSYGKPRTVDMVPGLVAVGTDVGTVLIYAYASAAASPSSSAGAGGDAAGAAGGRKTARGYGGAGRLNLVVEIPPPPPPPPPASSSSAGAAASAPTGAGGNGGGGGHAVSSLHLVQSEEGGVDRGGRRQHQQQKGAAAATAGRVGFGGGGQGSGGSSSGGTKTRTRIFVTYRRTARGGGGPSSSGGAEDDAAGARQAGQGAGGGGGGAASSVGGGGGVCCYDLGCISIRSAAMSTSATVGKPAARFDLDGRDVPTSSLCDAVPSSSSSPSSASPSSSSGIVNAPHYMVARPDGLYTYTVTDRVGVSPIDGTKIAMCTVPPPPVGKRRYSPSTSAAAAASASASAAAAGTNSSDDKVGGGSGEGADGENATSAGEKDGAAAASAGSAHALVATTDSKSGRDAVDIYDTTNKLVAFHVLLSPGHRALRCRGITTFPVTAPDGVSVRGGRSSALVLTSGGSLVTLTERVTSDKVNLLVQKNLFSAAISMAFADPTVKPDDVTALYRRHAEHLYRKGDYGGAMDRYVCTIGSLEPGHVIFRYLDAPKVPLLARYLEELRARGQAGPVHDELLRTCYRKLNDIDAADAILSSSLATTSLDGPDGCVELVSSRLAGNDPREALATLCGFGAAQAAEAMARHGPALARALPRETAGIVLGLCDGTYSPNSLADAAGGGTMLLTEEPEDVGGGAGDATAAPTAGGGDRYPVHLFASAFVEQPKLLRLLLSHCRRKKCALTPGLQRALLELTLEEWNGAKRTGDKDMEKVRRRETMGILTDPHFDGIGDSEALVLVQTAGFAEGEVYLYERMQMAPMLLERYAQDGGDRARRQMLAMCRTDPELLADVLGYFVAMAADRIGQDGVGAALGANDDESSAANYDGDDGKGAGEILRDIREALFMARAQGVLPPVRVARILAGEGTGEFSSDWSAAHPRTSPAAAGSQQSVPLSVALDYIGAILDESSTEVHRLRDDVEEYNRLCNSMEAEIKSLISSSSGTSAAADRVGEQGSAPLVDIEEMLSTLRESEEEGAAIRAAGESKTEAAQEEFWREIGHSEDRFETIARFFAKGIID